MKIISGNVSASLNSHLSLFPSPPHLVVHPGRLRRDHGNSVSPLISICKKGAESLSAYSRTGTNDDSRPEEGDLTRGNSVKRKRYASPHLPVLPHSGPRSGQNNAETRVNPGAPSRSLHLCMSNAPPSDHTSLTFNFSHIFEEKRNGEQSVRQEAERNFLPDPPKISPSLSHSQKQDANPAQEDHRARFYEDYRKVAEEYDRGFLKKRDDDLNTTLIFVSSILVLDKLLLTRSTGRFVLCGYLRIHHRGRLPAPVRSKRRDRGSPSCSHLQDR